MNILMVHPHDLYSNLEPWTNRIKYIAKQLVSKGHRVKLVYFPLWNRPCQDGEPECGKDYAEFAFERKKTAIFKNIRRMAGLAADCDIVHFQKCFSHACLPSLFAAWLKRKPVHYDWDDWEMQIYNYDSPSRVVGLYLDMMERILPAMADTVSGASRRLRKLCIERGVDSARIFDSHVGADLEQFNPSVDGSAVRERYGIKAPLVLYLGQLHGAQYAELFIKSARLILDKGVNADFMIVGDGSRFFEFKNLVEELRLGDKIILTGAIPHGQIPEYIAACDVAVACFEDNDITRCKSPLKIAEYLASGKAVVASKVGDVPQMISGCGVLTAPGDIDNLSQAVIRLLGDGKLRQELGQNARRRAEKEYNWAVTAGNLLDAYRLALGQYKV